MTGLTSAHDAVLRSRAGRLLRGVTAAVALVVPVVLLTFAVRQEANPIIAADAEAIRAATNFSRTHALTSALVVVQEVTQPVVMYSVCTVAVVWFGVSRRLRGRALWAFATMMTGWAVGGVSKLLVHRVRPIVDDPLSHAPGYSFPSGHALNIAVAGSVMVVMVWPLLGRTGRLLAVGLAVVVVVLPSVVMSKDELNQVRQRHHVLLHQLGRAGVVVDVEDAAPGDAAVGGLVDAALAAGRSTVAQRRDVDDVEVHRVDDDPRDLLAVASPMFFQLRPPSVDL